MTRSFRAAAAVAAGATAAALMMGAAPAHADVAVHSDNRKDVVGLLEPLLARSAEPLPFDVTPVPTDKSTDVTKVLVRHTKKRVAVRTSLRDLNEATTMAVHVLKTDKGQFQVQHALSDFRVPNRALGVRPHDEALFIMDANGDSIECQGSRATVKRAKDIARFSLPRRCLDNPKWVRGGTVVASFLGLSELAGFLLDSAYDKSLTSEDLAELMMGGGLEDEWPLGLSRRVKRA